MAYSWHFKNQCQWEEKKNNTVKGKIFRIIIKHSPTTFRHIPMQLVCWAPQHWKPYTCPGVLVRACRGPQFDSWLTGHFQFNVGDQHFHSPQQLCNALPLLLFCMYFFQFVYIKFWCANKMKCCLFERGFTILSYAAWIPFIGFSWIGLLLSASHRNNHGRRSCT